MTGVAPNDLADADYSQDSSIERPMLVPLHRAAPHSTPGKVESLHNPNASQQEQQNTNDAADEPHDSIEHMQQNTPPDRLPSVSERILVRPTRRLMVNRSAKDTNS